MWGRGLSLWAPGRGGRWGAVGQARPRGPPLSHWPPAAQSPRTGALAPETVTRGQVTGSWEIGSEGGADRDPRGSLPEWDVSVAAGALSEGRVSSAALRSGLLLQLLPGLSCSLLPTLGLLGCLHQRAPCLQPLSRAPLPTFPQGASRTLGRFRV